MKGHFTTGLKQLIIPLSDLTSNHDAGKLEFMGYINGTPSLAEYHTLKMEFITGSNKAGEYVCATGIRELLAKCGFSTDKHFSQRRKCLHITPGNLDYVTDLMRLAHEAGRINVCVLTDYDIDGNKHVANS